ncbi:hypothetical protein MetMK1DRAFT_00014240 [Metallosphaera yellowstonensis MK1]|uniref:Transposase n=1 Tax=Metallosphaera yellowstonensis MK1 TaxID=671065 RepID=H2C425_9CREN|nr:hypothetical protein MetMK1DRAFT_00014240 [Metallosphaera yellowstonensis MK1]
MMLRPKEVRQRLGISYRCGFTLDRQLNASLNISLKMCGFPHLFLTPTGSRWV